MDSSAQRTGWQFCWWGKDHSPPWDLFLDMCKQMGVQPPFFRINLIVCELRYWGRYE